MYGRGQKSLPDVRVRSGVAPGCPGFVGMPYVMSGSGREALPDVLVLSGDPPLSSGVI